MEAVAAAPATMAAGVAAAVADRLKW
jgi:hypothetical protein